MKENIEIPISKFKMILLLIGALSFVLLGTMFSYDPEYWVTSVFSNKTINRIFGIISIIFFGACLISITQRLMGEQKIGLRIDEFGITDNTNATSVGLIEWSDIIQIEKRQVASTKFLLLKTTKPDKYISRAKNNLAKRAMKANYKMYGTPISIISNSLKINFNELEEIILSEFKKRKNNKS